MLFVNIALIQCNGLNNKLEQQRRPCYVHVDLPLPSNTTERMLLVSFVRKLLYPSILQGSNIELAAAMGLEHIRAHS